MQLREHGQCVAISLDLPGPAEDVLRLPAGAAEHKGIYILEMYEAEMPEQEQYELLLLRRTRDQHL